MYFLISAADNKPNENNVSLNDDMSQIGVNGLAAIPVISSVTVPPTPSSPLMLALAEEVPNMNEVSMMVEDEPQVAGPLEQHLGTHRYPLLVVL